MATVILFIGLFAFKQTQENKRYEEYLSLQMFNDYSRLASSIMQNQIYYEEILETKSITSDQMRYLHQNNSDMTMVAQEYLYFAVDLKRINADDISNITSTNAASVGNYFRRLASHFAEELGVYNEGTYDLMSVNILPDETFPLEKDTLKDIEMIRDLNEEWLAVVVENVNGAAFNKFQLDHELYSESYFEETIEKEFWVEVTVKLEKVTERFLKEQNVVHDIGTLLNNSTLLSRGEG
jgi:hypothetical protein